MNYGIVLFLAGLVTTYFGANGLKKIFIDEKRKLKLEDSFIVIQFSLATLIGVMALIAGIFLLTLGV